jgi:hypothetical protein
VYISIYNTNPMFKIDNPQEFAQALMHYIATEGVSC